jgi:hypothetical protein
LWLYLRWRKRLGTLSSNFGLMQTAPIEAVIDQWFLKGNVDTAAGQPRVLFKDLKSDLRIIASDIDTRSAVVFSRDETPNVAVAQAVAASIAIPLFFRPVKLDIGPTTRTLVDGKVGISTFDFELTERAKYELYQHAARQVKEGLLANFFPRHPDVLRRLLRETLTLFCRWSGINGHAFKDNPLIGILNFDSDSVTVAQFERSKAAAEWAAVLFRPLFEISYAGRWSGDLIYERSDRRVDSSGNASRQGAW